MFTGFKSLIFENLNIQLGLLLHESRIYLPIFKKYFGQFLTKKYSMGIRQKEWNGERINNAVHLICFRFYINNH